MLVYQRVWCFIIIHMCSFMVYDHLLFITTHEVIYYGLLVSFMIRGICSILYCTLIIVYMVALYSIYVVPFNEMVYLLHYIKDNICHSLSKIDATRKDVLSNSNLYDITLNFTGIVTNLPFGEVDYPIPSGTRLHNYGKSPFLMGKLTKNGYFQ